MPNTRETVSTTPLEALLSTPGYEDLRVFRERTGILYVIEPTEQGRNYYSLSLPDQSPQQGASITVEPEDDHQRHPASFVTIDEEGEVAIDHPQPGVYPEDAIKAILRGSELFDAYLAEQDPYKKSGLTPRIFDYTRQSDRKNPNLPFDTPAYWQELRPVLVKALQSLSS